MGHVFYLDVTSRERTFSRYRTVDLSLSEVPSLPGPSIRIDVNQRKPNSSPHQLEEAGENAFCHGHKASVCSLQSIRGNGCDYYQGGN